MAPTTLFKLPIASTSGTVTVTLENPDTHKRVYLISIVSPPDNRLTTSFIDAYMLALDVIQSKYPLGVVVTTSGIAKFFSNGLDLDHARATEGFFKEKFGFMLRRLLTYPMPTIALINGHGFAGAFILAMCHDYRIMNPAKGFLCMNEIEFGAPLSPALISIFREKVPDRRLLRKIILESHRFSGKEALQDGIVDVLGGYEQVLKIVDQHKLETRVESGVWGTLRRQMWPEAVKYAAEDYGFELSTAVMAKGDKYDEVDIERADKAVKALESKSKL